MPVTGPVAKAARTSRSSATSAAHVGRLVGALAEAAHGRLEQSRDAREVEGAGRGSGRRPPRRRRSARPTPGGPRRPASRAMRSAGNRVSSGARKSSRAAATRSGGVVGDGESLGVGEGVLDRETHVRGAQLGLQGAVDEQDGRVDDALRMDDDVDRVVAHIVQPVGLDDLQALVGERRGVDRDLGSHRPGRVLAAPAPG